MAAATRLRRSSRRLTAVWPITMPAKTKIIGVKKRLLRIRSIRADNLSSSGHIVAGTRGITPSWCCRAVSRRDSDERRDGAVPTLTHPPLPPAPHATR